MQIKAFKIIQLLGPGGRGAPSLTVSPDSYRVNSAERQDPEGIEVTKACLKL